MLWLVRFGKGFALSCFINENDYTLLNVFYVFKCTLYIYLDILKKYYFSVECHTRSAIKGSLGCKTSTYVKSMFSHSHQHRLKQHYLMFILPFSFCTFALT